MIAQHDNQLVLTFPSAASATTFALFLQSLLSPQGQEISSPLSEPLLPEIPASPERAPSPVDLFRSRHTVLTPERQDQLAEQRANGMTERQRLLRAQTTLRDGVLPFSKPGEVPKPTGQLSPRMKAQVEGMFADGSADPPAPAKSKLRPSFRPTSGS